MFIRFHVNYGESGVKFRVNRLRLACLVRKKENKRQRERIHSHAREPTYKHHRTGSSIGQPVERAIVSGPSGRGFSFIAQRSTAQQNNNKHFHTPRWRTSKRCWPMSATWWRWRNPSACRRHGPARRSSCRIQGEFPTLSLPIWISLYFTNSEKLVLISCFIPLVQKLGIFDISVFIYTLKNISVKFLQHRYKQRKK